MPLPERDDLLHIQEILSKHKKEEKALQDVYESLFSARSETEARLHYIGLVTRIPSRLGQLRELQVRSQECEVLKARADLRRRIADSINDGELWQELEILRRQLLTALTALCDEFDQWREGEGGQEHLAWQEKFWKIPGELRLVLSITRKFCRIIKKPVVECKESPFVQACKGLREATSISRERQVRYFGGYWLA